MDSLLNIELRIDSIRKNIKKLHKEINSLKRKVLFQSIVIVFHLLVFLLGAVMVGVGGLLVYDIYLIANEEISILFWRIREMLNGWFWVLIIIWMLFGFGKGIAKAAYEGIKKSIKDRKNIKHSIEYNIDNINRSEIELNDLMRKKQTYNQLSGMEKLLD